MKNVLYINDVLVKPPSEIKIQRNKLWKTGSGRSRAGNFVGKIQARKYRVDVKWDCLTEDEASLIASLLEPDFITIKFIDPKTKQLVTKTVYAGDESYSVYNYEIQMAVYQGLPISLVEK